MKYLVSIVLKTILLPICLLLFIPAYILFIVHPEMNKFKFKMER